MSMYVEVLKILGMQPGFIVTTILFTLLAFVYLAFVGTWLPLLLRESDHRDLSGDDAGHESAISSRLSFFTMFALAIGGGLVLSLGLGTASAYVFKQLLPGMVASLVIGLVTSFLLFSRLRREGFEWGIGLGVFAVITAVPFCMGLWHHLIMLFPFVRDSQLAFVFADLHRDSGFHVYLASILSESGLPLIDLNGSPTTAYSPVTHTGHGILMGGLSALLQMTIYRASTVLWIVALVLLAWSAAVLLLRAAVPKVLVVLGSACPLLLGPVTVPPISLLAEPQMALNQSPLLAARMYWNLPQALSTALAAMALLCFDGYCRAPARSRSRRRWVVATALALVVSGWVKPSLFIFYAPALVIALLVHRAALRDIAGTFLILAAGIAIYFLPAWLVTVAKHPGWSIHPGLTQTKHVAIFVILGCGPALLLSIEPLRRLFRHFIRKSAPEPLTLALTAMGGSLLFALLFREDRFANLENPNIYQPNLWWGPSACVVLLLPLLLRSTVKRINVVGKADRLTIAALILLPLQMLSGTLFAVAYPAILGRAYPSVDVEILRAAKAQTAPGTRCLLDPILNHRFADDSVFGMTDIVGLLARPCLFETLYMAEADRENLTAWRQLFLEPFEPEGTGWEDYDAAILSDQAEHARQALSERGWTSEKLPEEFHLWRRPAGATSP